MFFEESPGVIIGGMPDVTQTFNMQIIDKLRKKRYNVGGGDEKMNMNKLFLTKNQRYQQNDKFKPTGIMVHSTGANNATLKRYVGPDDGKLGVNQNGNHWNSYHPGGKDMGPHTMVDKDSNGICDTCGGRQVCVHAFIGKLADGSVATYQTLPWDIRGWHGGKGKNGSVNSTHIGFEICEDGLTDKTYFDKVYKEAVELCAYLCKEYGISPTKPNLIDHSEGYSLGLASNHGDVKHWFTKHGKTMDIFRTDVATKMKDLNAPVNEPKEEIDVGVAEELLKKIEALEKKNSELEKKLAEAPAPAKRYQKLSELPSWAKPAVEKRLHLFSNIDPNDGQKILNITEDMFRPWVLEDNARFQNIEQIEARMSYAVPHIKNRIDSKEFSDPKALDLTADMIRTIVLKDRRDQKLGLLDDKFNPIIPGQQQPGKAVQTLISKT